MPKPRNQGDLNARVLFQQRGEDTDDGYGNKLANWATVVDRQVSLLPTKGREEIVAGRAQGTASWDLWVRRERAIAALSSDCRIVDFHDARRTFNVVFGPVDMDGDNEWLFLQLMSGGADG